MTTLTGEAPWWRDLSLSARFFVKDFRRVGLAFDLGLEHRLFHTLASRVPRMVLLGCELKWCGTVFDQPLGTHKR